ncbi:MAG: helix-turn-helix domain-containing protein [Desulfobacterales bacterium]|nr:helix-turn-helix domain-containing protein [Desulfobacterales bacterium]
MLVPIQKDRQEADLPGLLTPTEVAKKLRIGYRGALDLIALGKLRAYRIGRVYRISRKELQRYLESTRVESPWSK